MSLAKYRKIYDGNGSGRFVVSEGIAPSAYLLPHPGLPTLYTDIEDDRFEIVMTKGTILSVVADSNGDSRVVPANGTDSAVNWDDNNDGGIATPGGSDAFTVAAESTPIGCAQYDLYRPFDKGTSQGAGWITHGYVEWPLIENLNDDLVPGDIVRADSIGRPVKLDVSSESLHLAVGKVIEIEKFATNYDDGLLSYMQLPSDPGGLQKVYELTSEGPFQGKLGIRKNLDRPDAVGAFRVNLTL